MADKPEGEAAWYCLRTQIKRESLAAAALRELGGIEVVCPRLRYRKVTRRGKIWWVEPLFPGYLLARFVLSDLERAVNYAKGVSRILKFGEHIPTVPGRFVDDLRRELAQEDEKELITLEPVAEPGDEVELAEGPLQGLSGTVIEVRPAEERVRIFVEFLGQEQPVDVDLYALLLPRKPIPKRDG